LRDLAARLEELTSRVDFDQAEVARVVDTNTRTVSRWVQRQASPRPEARERLLELLAVLEHLSGVLRPQAAHDWLFTPNPQLEHHKPVELLRDGEYRRVLGAVDALGEGAFV
jgi:putative toxin-antitoxin system antitoxin component (TIGR02293 family)